MAGYQPVRIGETCGAVARTGPVRPKRGDAPSGGAPSGGAPSGGAPPTTAGGDALPASADQPLRRFFSALAAENFAALEAAILIVSPVDGLRPSRAARWLTLNLPKPASATSPPAASSSETTSSAASTT